MISADTIRSRLARRLAGATSTGPRRPRAPGPQGLELLRVLAIIARSPLEAMDYLAQNHGDVALLEIFGGPLFVVRGAEQVKQILITNQDNYVKSEHYRLMWRLLGKGLVTNEGASWQRQRSLVQPMFAQRHLVPFADHMSAAAAESLTGWEHRFAAGGRVEIAREMTDMTLDIVGRALLGADVTALNEGFAAASATANQKIGAAGRSPVNVVGTRLPWLTPERAFKLQFRRWRAHDQAVSVMDEVVERLIDGRMGDSGSEREDLLGLLLAARDEDTGEPMSRAQVRDELMTFIAAGHETTANGLAWMWYLLSEHPLARDRLLAEVDEVLRGETPGADAANRLPWTSACFQEAMRLYPPVWHVQRQALNEDVLDGHRVPAGSVVLVSTWTTHRDPAVWPNPAGFDPRRFLGDAPKTRPRHAYFPFGGGRRVCVGQGFAMMEAVILTAMIAQRYTLDFIPGSKVALDPTITLRPLHGLPMTVHPRVVATLAPAAPDEEPVTPVPASGEGPVMPVRASGEGPVMPVPASGEGPGTLAPAGSGES
jgi:cytochrome P450